MMQERRDRLDREGAMLWNRCTTLKQCKLVFGQKHEDPELEMEENSSDATDEDKAFQQLVSLGEPL